MTSFPGNERTARRRSCDSGFTLIELLTVLALIALIGGMGAGAYQMVRRNYALSTSAGRVQGVLRAARNTSLSTGVPSFVEVDPVAGTVTAHAFDRVAEWSFDAPQESLAASLGTSGYTNHGAAAVPGKVGSGLRFGPGAYLDCGAASRFDLRTTIHVAAWVRHRFVYEVPPSRRVEGRRRPRLRPRRRAGTASRPVPAGAIVEKAGAYFFGLARDGSLESAVGERRVRTRSGVVAGGRWVHVSMRFDGVGLTLSVDGVPRQTRPLGGDGGFQADRGFQAPDVSVAPWTAPVTQTPLTISSPESPLEAELDEVRLSGGVEPLVYQLADYEKILGWKKLIHFDRYGHLAPGYHEDAVQLLLVELGDEGPAEGSKTSVFVDYSLTFEEWLARWDDPPDLREADEVAKLEAALGDVRKIVITVDRLGVVQ